MQNWQGGPPQGGGYPQGGYGAPQQQAGYGQAPGGPQQQPGAPQGYGAAPQQGAPQPPAAFGAAIPNVTAEQGKGFVRALFDFSFRTSIGPTVIKVVYGLVCLMAVGSCLASLFGAYDALDGYYGPRWDEVFIGLAAACFAPIVTLVIGRLYCEILAAVFRIADNLQAMNDRQKTSG